MKPITSFALLSALATLAAQGAVTTPVGYTTEVISGKAQPSDPAVFNLIGLTLHQPTLVAGALEAVDSSSVTDNDVDFGAVLGSGTFLLEITSGSGLGLVQSFTSFSGGQITGLPDLTTLGVAGGDSYRVRKAATLTDIFGDADSTDLEVGDETTADVVWVSTGGGFSRYYVSPPAPPFQPDPAWTLIGGGSADPASDPIVYTGAVIVQRRGVGDLPIVVTGEVKIDSTLAFIASVDGDGPEYEFNYLSTVYPVKLSQDPGVTIDSESTVASFNLDSIMVAGDPASDADILWLPDGLGGYKRYFNSPPAPPFKPDQSFDEIGVGAVDPATVEMPSGFILQRRAGNGDLYNELSVPPAYSNL